MGEDDPGTNHGGRGGRVGRIPRDDRHRAVSVGICLAPKGRVRCGIWKNHGGVGAGGDGGVAGDFEGADDLAEGLFAATASSEAFEGGYSNRGEKSHNANDGEEFDEGERRRTAARG